MNKLLICLLLLFNVNASFAQLSNNHEIERLFELYEKYSRVDKLKALHYAKQASLLAEKTNDSKDKTYSYIYMSRTLSFLGLQKECYYYIEKAINEKHYKNDVIAQAMIKQVKHNNYNYVKLKSEGMRESLEILELLKDVRNFEAARIKVRASSNVADYYRHLNNLNQTWNYLKQAEYILNEPVFENKNTSEARSLLYLYWGYYYFDLHRKDSALYFIKKSVDVVRNQPMEFKFIPYQGLAEFYLAEHNYKEALNYYLLSIGDIESKKWNCDDGKLIAYKQIAYIYGMLNDSFNKNLYEQKYYKENERRVKYYSVSVGKAVSLILKEKEIDKINIIQRYQLHIMGLVFIFILISLLIYRYLSKKKNILLIEKDNQLHLKDQENQKLKENLTPKLDYIKKMAKENNPLFFVKFQEVFPQFQGNLLKINSNLQKSELELLAYIFMNFETKEIADYTFKSPKTVQNRKHQLRKKLGIPTTDDMYVWLKSNCS